MRFLGSSTPKMRLRPGRWGAYSAPPELLAGGRGLAAPPQEQHPRCRLFGSRASALGAERSHCSYFTKRPLTGTQARTE